MPQNKNKSNSYIAKYRKTRKIGAYKFNLDLRHIKDDSQLTTGQKSMITRVTGEYDKIAAQHRNGTIKLIKPRRHKNETDNQYRKRVRKLREINTPYFKHINVIPIGVPAKSKYKIEKDGIITITRDNSELKEFWYSIDGDLRFTFLQSPAQTIELMVEEHNRKHPHLKAQLVGLATAGHLWQMKAAENIEEMADDFEKDILIYKDKTQDKTNITDFITHLLIRG